MVGLAGHLGITESRPEALASGSAAVWEEGIEQDLQMWGSYGTLGTHCPSLVSDSLPRNGGRIILLYKLHSGANEGHRRKGKCGCLCLVLPHRGEAMNTDDRHVNGGLREPL